MKKAIYFLAALFLLAACGDKAVQKTKSGVLIKLDAAENRPTFVKVDVVNENIIHVQGLNQTEATETSLVVLEQPDFTDWKMEQTKASVKLITASVTAEITLGSGEIKFTDKDGNVKLQEVTGGAKTMVPFSEGEKTLYRMQQIFESPADEAFYGLGQHQNGEFNYKGSDVELLQNNIVAVVPFLYSNKNYGILWDNYSITRFGDPREYGPINTLKLKDKNGNEGGLTATYYDAKGKVVLERQENQLAYDNLETIKNFPAEYKMANNAKIVWEGYIGSNVAGVHKFRLWSASYIKLWVNDQLVFDKWRQCWNPWYNKFNLDLAEGELQKVKIEWTPDADVAYVGLTYLDSKNAENQDKLSLFSESGKKIDYYFVNGNNAEEVIAAYRDLTGKAPILPKWSLGLWQSRERYKTQQELLDVVREYRKRNIPFDNIVLDWNYWPQDFWGDHDFDLKRFPDAQKMTEEVHALNAHIMISVWPKFYVGTENYKKFELKGWLFTKNVDLGNRDWIGEGYLSTFYDTYNPEARQAFWDGLNEKLFSKGFDAWWLDATEPDIHSNVSLAEKKSTTTPNHFGSGEEFFNTYSLLQSKGVYDGQRATNPDQRVFILTRSAFAGQQRYSAVTWSGDIVSRWEDLSDQVRAGLNMALSGIPYWTTDIGGFAVEKRYENKDPKHLDEWRELNLRWYQFGVFCPLFRIHGQFPYREIWNIAPEGTTEYKSMLYYNELRYKLMPYIYSITGMTYHKNSTIMRPLVMDFGTDNNVKNIGDQFMFGPALMACPVTKYQQRNREVYLPKGNGWYDYYTGEYYEGGQVITASAPLERIPLLVKAGSIIPFGPQISYAMEETGKPIKLVVYKGADAAFDYYEDAGDNYNYEKGEYMIYPIKYNEAEGKVNIQEPTGGLTEKSITFEVYFADPSNGKADVNVAPAQTIVFKGKSQL